MPESFLTGKTILIISPQAWGNMLISKHHYALELAKRGNQVYFLNPPDNYKWNLKSRENRITIRSSPLHPNLQLIDQVLYFPYILKYHARNLYNFFIKKQINDVLKLINKPVNLIWSFDLGNLFPLTYFKGEFYKVFHPVDEPSDDQAIIAAKGADIIFSVTQEILDKYKNYPVGRQFINHGLAVEFAEYKNETEYISEKIQAGMSGNLLRTDLDRITLLTIVRENPGVEFQFFGSYQAADLNSSGKIDASTKAFLSSLKSFSNVHLKGVLKTKELAMELNKMDILLVCYDMDKDQSQGTNYHKLMEYLSTGKVIVSNNITTYSNNPDLIRMVNERRNNNELPALFRETVLNIHFYNNKELVEKRKQFALYNTYSKHLDTINERIESGLYTSSSVF